MTMDKKIILKNLLNFRSKVSNFSHFVFKFEGKTKAKVLILNIILLGDNEGKCCGIMTYE